MSESSCRGLLTLAGALIACGGSDQFTGPAPTPPVVPASISILSGDGQKGRWGELLGSPFVVVARDSDGRGVANALITWKVVAGNGGFGDPRFETSAAFSVRTVGGGLAHVFLAPGLGTTTVTATAEGLEQAVAFETTTDVAVVTFGWFGGIRTPEASADLSVPLGTTVEWVGIPHLVSTGVPPGGQPFELRLHDPTARAQFVPNVTGRWEYMSDPREWVAWRQWGWCAAALHCETLQPEKGSITVH